MKCVECVNLTREKMSNFLEIPEEEEVAVREVN